MALFAPGPFWFRNGMSMTGKIQTQGAEGFTAPVIEPLDTLI